MKKFLISQALKSLTEKSTEPYTVKIIYADNQEVVHGHGEPKITLRFTTNWTEWRVLIFRDIAVSECYCTGKLLIEGDDALRKLLRMSFRVPPSKRNIVDPIAWIRKQWQEVALNNKSRKQQLQNLRSHYALPSQFFHYMNGELYGYTEGYFDTGDESQNEAQYKKYHHMCRKMRLQPGDKLVEVGTAWGSMALIAAKEYGAQVTNYGLIPEQNVVFEERIRRMGLENHITNVVKDARDLGKEREKYDKYVSLGVLEHAGIDCLEEWIRNISDCLKPGGTGVLSFTGFMDHQLVAYTIAKNIWPGCYLPSLAKVLILMEKYNLQVVDIEDARFAYAETMQTMLDKINEHWAEIQQIDREIFTEQFRRTWEIYYIGSMEGMRHSPKKQLHAWQMTFTKGPEASYPETKNFLYETPIDLSPMNEYEIPLSEDLGLRKDLN